MERFLEPKKPELDTGSKPACIGTFLLTITDDLSNHFYITLKVFADRVGAFASLMLSPDNQRVYVIAKSSQVWNDTVSTQATLPNMAAEEKACILMAIGDNLSVQYFLYRPEDIIKFNLGYNERFGVRFINWRHSMGCRFYPDQNLSVAYANLPKQTGQATFGGHF